MPAIDTTGSKVNYRIRRATTMISFDDLKRIEFFADLTDGELILVQGICQEVSYNSGDYIFAEDSPADNLYILKKGKVSIEIKVASEKYLSVYTVSRFAEPLAGLRLWNPSVLPLPQGVSLTPLFSQWIEGD